MLAGAKGGHIN